jgi:hypothetical protein
MLWAGEVVANSSAAKTKVPIDATIRMDIPFIEYGVLASWMRGFSWMVVSEVPE